MLGGQGLEVVHHLPHEGHDVHLLHHQFHLVVLYLAEVQDLVHHAQHAVGVAFHHLQLSAHLVRQL